MAITLDGTTGITSPAETVAGAVTAASVAATGAVSGTTGTFTSAVSGTTGTFTSAVSGTTGTFTGAVSGTTGTFTGVSTFPAGTALLPAITTTGDTNTGMWFPAADTIAFSEGGAEAVRIDSSGNVGIGTSSPTTKLHVYSSGDVTSTIGSNTGASILSLTSNSNASGAYNAILSNTASGQNWYIGGLGVANTLVFANGASTTERMRIDSSGNVGIGTASPSTVTLAVNGAIASIAPAGGYNIDTTSGALLTASGATVNFPSASGMLLVNNWSNGHTSVFLCGAGQTGSIGSVGGVVGSFAYTPAINGYTWTNTYGNSAWIGFCFIRTRPGA